MTKLDIVKSVAQFATCVGVGKVTHDVIKNNVNIDSTEDRIKVAVGSFVLGGMLADVAVRHVHTMIDDTVTNWKNRKVAKNATEETIIDAA